MKSTINLCFVLFFAMIALSTLASENESIVVKPLNYGSELSFHSQVLNEQQVFDLYLPEGYDKDADFIKYPVIYTLDGWALSQSVSGIVSHLGKTAGMPKAIVVAIKTSKMKYGPKIYASKSGGQNAADTRLEGFSGGYADDYLKFMKEELIPFIDNKYRTNDFRIIIGMSPTAAFALHTFWKAPELFDAHFLFAATDVIGMGYTPQTTFIDKIIESLENNPNRKGYLYIASAENEAKRRPKRVDNVNELKHRLKPFTSKNFKAKIEHIANYWHYPMALPGLLAAIEMVFPANEWTKYRELAKQEGKVLKNIEEHFARLSNQVGFTIYPNANLNRNINCFRAFGYRLLGQGKVSDAIDLFRRWTEYQPKEANAFDSLADALEKSGKLEQAIEARKQAVYVAELTQDGYLNIYRKNLNQTLTKHRDSKA